MGLGQDITGMMKEEDNEKKRIQVDSLCKYISGIYNSCEGLDSISFIISARREAIYLRKNIDDISRVEFLALVTDICNNMLHAYNDNYEYKDLRREFKYAKNGGIFEIIKACQEEKNQCYGIIDDPGDIGKSFIVDINGHGQIKWHFPREVTIKCKEYDYDIVKIMTDTQKENKHFLIDDINQGELDNLPEHIKIVRKSKSNDEMSNNLDFLYKSKKEENKKSDVSTADSTSLEELLQQKLELEREEMELIVIYNRERQLQDRDSSSKNVPEDI